MSKDLRYWIDYLERNHPEEIVRVKKEISTKWEISALMDNLQRQGKNPMLIFENVKDHKIPVVANLYASRKLHALAFETSLDMLIPTMVRGEENPITPKLVNSGPVKEVIKVGKDVNLGELPIVWHCEKDAGPFITPGVGTIKDPDTGIHNTGMYRHQFKGRNKLGAAFGPASHATTIRRKYEARGQDMEIAIALGHHPLFGIASQFNGSMDVDERAVFGAHLGKPAELVKCETVDLEVPTHCEIVIEGKVKHGYLETEGPMGEMFYYGNQFQNTVVEVTAITHRHDAIFQDLFVVGFEHSGLGNLGFESALYRHIKNVVPQLIDVRMANMGASKMVYLKVKQDYDGLAKQAALTALAFSTYITGVVTFDEDININSEQDVAWAMGTRIQADRSVMTVPEMAASRLDPLAHRLGDRTTRGTIKSKFVIDATKPVDIEFPERAYPPEETRQRMRRMI